MRDGYGLWLDGWWRSARLAGIALIVGIALGASWSAFRLETVPAATRGPVLHAMALTTPHPYLGHDQGYVCEQYVTGVVCDYRVVEGGGPRS